MGDVRVLEGGKRTAQLGFNLPEVGSPEFYLWVLIALEMSWLLWIRVSFKGASGG